MISKEDGKLLDRECPNWMEEIDLKESKLLAELKKRGVINPMEISVITAKEGNPNQVQKLVDTLRHGRIGKNTLDYTIHALCASGYEELAKSLRQPRVDDICASEVDGQAPAAAAGGASSASPPFEVLLSDQPLDVQVQLCTKKFRRDHRDKGYKMENPGNALIISPKKFGRPNLKELRGADVDRKNLVQLFEQLDLHVTLCTEEDDLTAQGIEDNVEKFASDSAKHKNADCVVFVISSHGKEGDEIYGTDGKTVSVQKLLDYFRNCPELKGKPKMFLVNACRGKKHFVAMQSVDTGSWFITAVVKVFMELACEKDVEAMLEEVKRSGELAVDYLVQRPDVLSQLQKEWFFFP